MFIKLRVIALAFLSTFFASSVLAEEEESSSGRQIEDVVVYGDRVESTVSDTSISITAMSEEFLMDMGIQGPDEMVNFIPATTRTDWISRSVVSEETSEAWVETLVLAPIITACIRQTSVSRPLKAVYMTSSGLRF